MPIGILYWMLFVIWLLFSGWTWTPTGAPYAWRGNSILLAILLFLIGLHDFGFILR